MSNIDKQAVQAVADLKAGYTLGHADVVILNELARIALASLEAEPVVWRYRHHNGLAPSNWRFVDSEDECNLAPNYQRQALYTAPPAPVAVPDDVSGPLAHAYKELTPTFMRNHIDVFERYGIYPDGSAGIQAMRIALDGMTRRAAMLQGADGNSPVIPDWQTQAEKMAELYGNSFVLFRNGESPQCADPSKVIISFTDEGLGHGSASTQKELK